MLRLKVAKVVAKHGAVQRNKANPAYNSTYTELPELYRTFREPLLEVGVVIGHAIEKDAVYTTLTDVETGESIGSRFPLPTGIGVGGDKLVNKKTGERVILPWFIRPLTAQEIKGAVTYGQRANILALLAVEETDDDGNTASGVSAGNSADAWY